MRFFTVLMTLLVALVCADGMSQAAPSAYLRAEVAAPASWDAPLTVRIVPDEKLCRERYGKNWEIGCDAQIGEYNAPARGIRLQPAVEGEWRWEYPRNLTFTPTHPLAPATTYTVFLDDVPLSSSVVFANAKATLTTLPLAAIIGEDQLWIDPSAKGAHGVSCSIRFTWPVEPEAMARRISLLPADPNAGLRLGKTEFVWSQNRDQVTMTARIDRLPEQAIPLEVRVTGLPRATVENGETTVLKATGTKVVSAGKERKTVSQDAVYRFSVKGASELFSITALTLKTGHDAGLGQEYRLELETSLHTRPADVIKAMQLVRLPHTNTPEAATPYDWSRAPHIAPEDLDRGTPLRLETLQSENEPVGKMAFRIRGLEATGLGRYLFVWLPAGFASSSGLTLPGPYTQVINAEPLREELDFLQPGNVLALGGERKLDIHSSGLTAIKWEVAQVREPFLALLTQASGRFSEPLRSFDGQQYEALSKVVRGDIQLSGKTEAGGTLAPHPGTPQFSVLDLAPLLRKDASDKGQIRGLMQVTLLGMNGDKPVSSAFDDPLTVKRFLLVTDLGLMVKKGASGTREVFVSSLSEGTPVSGVRVQILGVNGLPVLEAQTNAEGRATLASVSGLEREKLPVALVASHGDDLAWMPLGDTSLKVDTSVFPTAGRTSVSASVKNGMPLEGINAYVFGQRGMFRPGETVHFGMLVRRGDWTSLPADLPLEAVLVNPAGDVVLTRPFSVGGDGMASLSWNAPVSAMTGRYRLDVRVGGGDEGIVLGTGAVRLEEFQPDTLALNANIVPETAAGWLVLDVPLPAGSGADEKVAEIEKGVVAARNDPRAEVVLRNLYGLPAGDRRIRATMRVVPAALEFPGYEEFTFHDAMPYRGEAFQETLPETRTDKDGKASVLLPLSRLQSGTVRCEVLLEGFEPGGGRAVSLQREVVVSPLRTVLGYRTSGAGTNLAFLPQGRDTALEFVALDSHLTPVATGPLTFVVSARRYVSSLVTDASGRYRYDEVPVDTELSRSTGTIGAPTDVVSGTAEPISAVVNNLWKIPAEQPGEYLLTVRGADRQIMASVPFTVAGESLRLADRKASMFSETPGMKLASGKLRLRIDKTDYDAGEHIKLFVSTPYDGAGLITLERDGVFAHVWFRAKAGDSVHSIAIPDDFEGRGYVNVSLARSPDSPDIYMEPHSSAIVPFTASIRKRDMGLALAAPERVRPGDTVTVRLTARHPGKALVFAVDEGVLQLTRFQTPAPLEYLLLDRALEVETMQTFNVLMPDHAKLWGRIPGFGGDMASSGGRFLNPFKRRGEPPLAYWSGLVEVNPEGTVVTFPVPDYYNGKVRIMAVSSSGETIPATSHTILSSTPSTVGSAETSVTVRGSMVLTPQLPSVVVPGDTFEGFLALANNEIAGSSGKAPSFTLHLDTGAAFSLVGDMPSRVEVPEREEVVLPFRLKANDIPGAAEIRFRVTGTGTSTAIDIVREAALSVRPATHRLGTQRSGVTTRTVRIETGRQLYPFDASGSASVASVPLPALRGLVRYLDAYPHGCVEQLLSRAFPYVLLSGCTDLLVDPQRDEQTIRKQTDELIAAALSALQAGFRRGAGVSLWPGGDSDDLLTVYAGDFLLGLRESGRGVSALDGAVFDVIEQITGRSPSSLEDARIKAYGIWVLTREGRVTSQAVEQLVEWLHTEAEGWGKDVTASLLAGSCAIMRQDDLAQQFLAGYDATFKTFNTKGFMDLLAAQSLHTAVLARHFPANLKGDVAVQLVDSALNAVRQGQTTFSSAQGVRALMELSAVSRRADTPLNELRLTCVDGGTSTEAQGVLFGDLLMLETPGCSTYELQLPAGNTTSWYWQISSSGFDRVAPAQAGGQGMEVTRVYRDSVTGEPLTSVALGDEVVVDVRVQAHGTSLGGLLENIVVVDLLPGGFEMVLPRGNHREDAPLSTGKAGLSRMERREDRMIFFGNAGVEPLPCSYRIRAVNRGRFTLPPVQAEAMYAPALSAHSAAGSIEVK